MSMGSSWQVFSKAVPPERGSFPLDLNGDCASIVKEYLSCVRSAKGETKKCRDITKRYLECRMDKGIMERDDLERLGFNKEAGRWELGSPSAAAATTSESAGKHGSAVKSSSPSSAPSSK